MKKINYILASILILTIISENKLFGQCTGITSGQYPNEFLAGATGATGTAACLTGNMATPTRSLVAVGEASQIIGTTGSNNTSVGAQSLENLIGGHDNVAVGTGALNLNVSASYCVAIGSGAIQLGTPASQNTAVGYAALANDGSNGSNDAFGFNALTANTSGNSNVAMGQYALSTNISGSSNTAVGYSSLSKNLNWYNSAFGYQALLQNSQGSPNEAFGAQALLNNTSGSQNDAFGYQALEENSTGGQNCAFGYQSLNQNTSGYYNTAMGAYSLAAIESGSKCSAFGFEALNTNFASANDAFGFQTLYQNFTGGNNAAFGLLALYTNSTGNSNTAIGQETLHSTNGNNNVAVGYAALYNLGNYSGNVAIGTSAGYIYSYTDNVFIGMDADATSSTNGVSNAIAVGYDAIVSGNNYTQLGNTASTRTLFSGSATITSDGRFKKDIQENVPGLAFIKRLRPVTYHYDMHTMDKFIYGDSTERYEKEMAIGIEKKGKILYSGFIAQEVENSAKALSYDFSGVSAPQSDKDYYGLDYSNFVVPLVKGMQEQQKMIDEQQNELNDAKNIISSQGAQIAGILIQLQSLQDCCYGGEKDFNNYNVVPQLLNAAPNPASNSTTIYYYAPLNSKNIYINLKDSNGKVVETSPFSGSGYSSVIVQTSDLASGVYYYSLIVDDQIMDTKKLIISLK